MIIPVVSACHFPIESGIWRHIDLAAEDRLDTLCSRCPVKIDHAVHYSVIRDRSAVHAEFFHPRDIFFYLVRSIQQTILCMDMQMYKTHIPPLITQWQLQKGGFLTAETAFACHIFISREFLVISSIKHELDQFIYIFFLVSNNLKLRDLAV